MIIVSIEKDIVFVERLCTVIASSCQVSRQDGW